MHEPSRWHRLRLVVDERIGDKVYPTRSSVDLPVLRLLFTWAKRAGIVRVLHGKVLATKRGLALAAGPAGIFDRALDSLLDLGPVTAQRHPTRAWPSWPDIDRSLDGMTVALLIQPFVQRRLVPLSELTDVAVRTILKGFVFESGLRLGGDIGLTPAGLAAVQRVLSEAGIDVPVAGRWADASAEELLTGSDRDDWISFSAEIDAWRQRRTPEQVPPTLAVLETIGRTHPARPVAKAARKALFLLRSGPRTDR